MSVDVPAAVARIVRVHLLALARLEELVEEAEQSNQGVGTLRAATAVSAGFLDVLERTAIGRTLVRFVSFLRSARLLVGLRVRCVSLSGLSGRSMFRRSFMRRPPEVVRTFEEAIAPPKPKLRVVS